MDVTARIPANGLHSGDPPVVRYPSTSTPAGNVTYSPLIFAEKPTAASVERSANRTGTNVTVTTSTPAHALLRHGRIR